MVVGTCGGAVYTPTNSEVLEGAIEPTVLRLPPAMPLTSQVTVVVEEMVESVRVTVAVKSDCVLIGRVIAVGVIATDLTVVDPPPPVPLPPPQATKAKAHTIRSAKRGRPKNLWIMKN